MKDVGQSAVLQLGARFQQRVEPFGRDEPADGDQLGHLILVRDRLEPFLVKAVGYDPDLLGMIDVRT
ncbi:hypothetical protein D1872_304150 [compost metagenome]